MIRPRNLFCLRHDVNVFTRESEEFSASALNLVWRYFSKSLVAVKKFWL